MKVVLLGKGEMLANLIRGCILAGVDIVGVFRYERCLYSNLRLFWQDCFMPSPELTLIKKHMLYEIKCKRANSSEFKAEIIKLNADVILVGTWRERLKKEIYELPVIGTINVHPSLLPKYRGPNPYLQTIWHGEKESGVTFHLMNENFDEGAILAQAKVEILEGDTSRELKNKTVFKARILCAELLEKLKTSVIVPIKQDESKATYYKNINPEDMTLDFTKETAEEICAHIRAFYPFLPTYIQFGNKFYVTNPYKISTTKQSGVAGDILVEDLKNKSLTIAAKDGVGVCLSGLKLYRKFMFF